MPAKKKPAAHSRPKSRSSRTKKRTKRASLIRSLVLALACVLGVLAVIVAIGSLWMWQKLGMVDYDDSSTQYLDSLPPEEDDLLLPEGEEMEEIESTPPAALPHGRTTAFRTSRFRAAKTASPISCCWESMRNPATSGVPM